MGKYELSYKDYQKIKKKTRVAKILLAVQLATITSGYVYIIHLFTGSI